MTEFHAKTFEGARISDALKCLSAKELPPAMPVVFPD